MKYAAIESVIAKETSLLCPSILQDMHFGLEPVHVHDTVGEVALPESTLFHISNAPMIIMNSVDTTHYFSTLDQGLSSIEELSNNLTVLTNLTESLQVWLLYDVSSLEMLCAELS